MVHVKRPEKKSKMVGKKKRIDMSIAATKRSEKAFVKPTLKIKDVTKVPVVQKSGVYSFENIDKLGNSSEISENQAAWLASRHSRLNSRRGKSRKVGAGKSKRLGDVLGKIAHGAAVVGSATGHVIYNGASRIAENAKKEGAYRREQGHINGLAQHLGVVRDSHNPERFWLDQETWVDVPIETTQGELMLKNAVAGHRGSTYGRPHSTRRSGSGSRGRYPW